MINIKFFLGYIFTVWLFFIAYIYLILGVDNYSLVSLILGIVGLVVGIFRIRKIIIQKEDGYSYLEPLRKVSEGLICQPYFRQITQRVKRLFQIVTNLLHNQRETYNH